MTKKRQGNRDNDKKMSPKEKQVLSTFNKLNFLIHFLLPFYK